MVDPVSIGAGLLAGNVLYQAAERFDDTDEEISQALEEDDLERALYLANNDEHKINKLFRGLREAALMQHGDKEDVEADIQVVREYHQENIAA